MLWQRTLSGASGEWDQRARRRAVLVCTCLLVVGSLVAALSYLYLDLTA